MKEVDQLFLDLAKSPFRRRFQLRAQELRYFRGRACMPFSPMRPN